MEGVEEILMLENQSSELSSDMTGEAQKTKGTRMEDLYNKVKYYLDEEKVFLNPKLSLAKFSLIVGTNTSHSYR